MLIVVITLLLIGQKSSGKAMVVSVSTDGHYALSSNEDKTVTLWNLKRHNYRIVGTNANIYSTYFIPHSHKFIWQDLNDIVHVQNVEGTQLKHFHNFPTYGEVMTSDLEHYFASNDKWGLYYRYGSDLQHKKLIKSHCDVSGFWSVGKLLNLSLSNNQKYLLSVGNGGSYDKIPISVGQCSDQAGEQGYEVGITNQSLLEGPVLWQVKTGQPIQKFPGLQVKSFATISPDNQYVIGGDESSSAFLWSIDSREPKFRLDSLYRGRRLPKCDNGTYCHWDDSGIIKPPDDFVDKDAYKKPTPHVISLKFIDKHHYLRFTTYVPYAALYKLHKRSPSHYFRLADHQTNSQYWQSPIPSVNDYQRNASIDTSWRAHILVTGQQKQGGIIVYKYNPNKQSLKKVWAPQPKKWQVWLREWI